MSVARNTGHTRHSRDRHTRGRTRLNVIRNLPIEQCSQGLQQAMNVGNVGAPWEGRYPRVTWARLEIHIGGECVALVEDQESRSSRRAIYCPLYPLAEWVAYNWWFLRADSRPRDPQADRVRGICAGPATGGGAQ